MWGAVYYPKLRGMLLVNSLPLEYHVSIAFDILLTIESWRSIPNVLRSLCSLYQLIFGLKFTVIFPPNYFKLWLHRKFHNQFVQSPIQSPPFTVLSETVHRNILKVRNLIEHYSSHEFRGSGDHNLVNYWSCQVPSHLAVSEAQEVTSLDNCVEFICRSEFDINCSAPPKQRMQMPCQQYQLTCQLAPVPLLLQPRYTYYCKRCHNMVLTTSSWMVLKNCVPTVFVGWEFYFCLLNKVLTGLLWMF